MTRKTLILGLATLVVATFALVPTASAHKTTYTDDGKIKIVWGFLNEPAVTWTKTGLDLILTDNATGAPILGASDTIEVHLKHGDDELHLDDLRAQHGKPGAYSQVVTLTKPGLYTINIHGKINGSDVDMDIAGAHEIHEVEETFFPAADHSPYEAAAAPDTSALATEIAALKNRIAALEAKQQTQSTMPVDVTPQSPATSNDAPLGVLVLALGLVGAALVLRRRS